MHPPLQDVAHHAAEEKPSAICQEVLSSIDLSCPCCSLDKHQVRHHRKSALKKKASVSIRARSMIINSLIA